MQIDWLTIAAQIVNFLVLVWLLQRFLYRPITEAMQNRETRIEDRLAEARQTREAAEAEAQCLAQEHRDLQNARDRMLDEARAEAEELRATLDAEIRRQMQDRRETWLGTLAQEHEAFARRVKRRAGQQVIDIAEHVLADFADTDLNERIATTFIARLQSLDPDARQRLGEAARRAEHAVVTTGHTIGSATRARVTRALHEALSTDMTVEYREDPDALLGMRVTIGEQTVEWSAAHHLDRLERALDEILDSDKGHILPRQDGPAGAADAQIQREEPSAT